MLTFVISSVTILALGAQPSSLVKTTGGCQVEVGDMFHHAAAALGTTVDSLAPRARISWTGNCAAGRVSGAGELSVAVDDWRLWGHILDESRGATYQEGVAVFNAPATHSWTFTISECRPSRGFTSRQASVIVDDRYDLSNQAVVRGLLDRASKEFNMRCPIPGAPSFRMHLYIRQSSSPDPIVICSNHYEQRLKRGFDDASPTDLCGEFDNKLVTRLIFNERDRIQQARRANEARELEARRAQEAKVKGENIAQFQKFSNAHKISQWASTSAFCTNPYRFGSQVIGIGLSVFRIVSPTEGLFSTGLCQVHAVGISANSFTEPGQHFLAAVQVGRSTTGWPTVRIIGVFDCPPGKCSSLPINWITK